MTSMRERAKARFPGVLLTLLSIVQALALELLWSHIAAADYLYELTPVAATAWLQIAVTGLGIVIIWLVYASMAMRFAWVPTMVDSTIPFAVGVLEFSLVGFLGAGHEGLWFLALALAVAMMHWIGHHNMVRARLEPENDRFFEGVGHATLRDFIPHIAVVGALAATGLFLWIWPVQLIFQLGLLLTGGMLVWQFVDAGRFWEQSLERA